MHRYTTPLGLLSLAVLLSACGDNKVEFRNIGGCEIRPNTVCRGADLSGFPLNRVDLSGADLRGANLTGVSLNEANLTGANLSEALLVDADLADANLTRADLTLADLENANMSGTICAGADLTDANFTGANTNTTIWDDTTCPDGVNSDDAGGSCKDNLDADPEPEPNPDPNPEPMPGVDPNPDPDPVPDEVCDDDEDNDEDGDTDCDDDDCVEAPNCGPQDEICDDNEDNDEDGDTDCRDSDCADDPSCPLCGNETCEDGEDEENCPADCAEPMMCDGEEPNACGGCVSLDGEVGDVCGTCDQGRLSCDGIDALVCGDDPGEEILNACGGCAELDVILDSPCGPCELGSIVCDGTEATTCDPICGSACESNVDCVLGDCSNNVCVYPDFAFVPAGSHTIGAFDTEPGFNLDEVRHEVTLTHGYMIGQREVTQGDWNNLMGDNPSANTGCAGCPVESVTFASVLQFLNRNSILDNLDVCYHLDGCIGDAALGTLDCATIEVLTPGENPYLCEGWRLPTDAEWEIAARAGTDTSTYAGDITTTEVCVSDPVLDTIAVHCANSNEETRAVASKPPNALGMHDVLGNVYEWVWDRAGDFSADPVTDPFGPAFGENRILRGGSFNTDAIDCRVATRLEVLPSLSDSQAGFRIARTLDPSE